MFFRKGVKGVKKGKNKIFVPSKEQRSKVLGKIGGGEFDRTQVLFYAMYSLLIIMRGELFFPHPIWRNK